MKMTVAFLLLSVVFSSPSLAQEPRIISFDPGGDLSWTNATTNVYCGVEWSSNLRYPWHALGTESPQWDVLATQNVTTTTISDWGALWEQLQVIGQILGDVPQGLFIRIVSSPELLGPRYVTNDLRLANSSSIVLSNVTFGLKQGGSYHALTNLGLIAQAETSQFVSVWQQWPMPTSSTITFPSATPVQDGWYVSYDQGGSSRTAEGSVIPFGPWEKKILLVVSNSSITFNPEWLNFSRSFSY